MGNLVSEATNLLRSLRLGSEPHVRVCMVKKLHAGENPLQVTVQLVAGEVTMKQYREIRTLLANDPVQKIIPLGKIVDVGYVVVWTKEGCRVEHV